MPRGLSRPEAWALTAVFSSCSLVYQMAIAGAFVLLTGDDTLWQSLTLAVYLAAAGAGAWLASRARISAPPTENSSPRRGDEFPTPSPGGRASVPSEGDLSSHRAHADAGGRLFRVELCLSLTGGFSVVGILSVETAYWLYAHYYAATPEFARALRPASLLACQLSTLLVGLFSGFELPLLLRLSGKGSGEGPERPGAVLGMNYLGALAGSLAFSFLLFPRLGPLGASLAAATLTWAACLYLLLGGCVASSAGRRAALVLGAGGLAAALLVSRPLHRFSALAYYSGFLGLPEEAWKRAASWRGPSLAAVVRGLAGETEAILRLRSRYQSLDLVTLSDEPSWLQRHYNRRLEEEKDLPSGLALFLDRRYQFQGATEAIYHEHLAHVPVQLFGRIPRDVLILGGGDGLLARELLKYGDRLRSVTLVELDPAMIALARGDPRLRVLNGRSLDDPKVRTVIADAFFFVRNERRGYDAVYMDFPYPRTYNLTRLYSVEFFRNVARLLRGGGFAAMDYPLEGEDKAEAEKNPGLYRANSIIVNTLMAAGCRTLFPYDTKGPELLPRYEARLLSRRGSDEEPEISRLLDRIEALRFKRRHPGVPTPPLEGAALVENVEHNETLLAFSPGRVRLDFSFKDHGIRLYSLNPYRLKALEGGRFPYAEDPGLVNSIFRPRLLRPLRLAGSGTELD